MKKKILIVINVSHYIIYIVQNKQHSRMKKFGKNLTVGVQEQMSESHLSQNLKPVFNRQSHSGATSDFDEDRSNKLEVGDSLNNVVQFQQFFVDDEDKLQKIKKSQLQSLNLSRHQATVEVQKLSSRTKGKNKKQFTIQVAQSKFVKAQNTCAVEPREDFKEPPAPSNKTSFKARNFIFPNGDDSIKKEEINEEVEHNVQQLIKAFDRERQEFYRQKSKYEKQILVKEGQIELLQKMLTGSILKQGGHIPSLNISHQNIQSLFLKKDLQISQLLQRINELNKIISLRGQDIKQMKIDNAKLILENQTLINRIYLLQNKEINNITTQQFYQRHRINSIPISSKTQQINSYRKGEQFNYLTKRLEVLSQNRKELQQRNKIKSEFSYSQPPKYTETPFDGREKKLNQTKGHRF